MTQSVKLFFIFTLFVSTISCSQQNRTLEISTEDTKKNKAEIVKRFGSVIKIKPEMLKQYKELHAEPWPGILQKITECNIRNYSIYLKDDYLFAYFEYTGTDFDSDMVKMAKDSLTKEWWKLTDPCQVPLESRGEGEWWADMEEVFHHD